MTDLRTWWQKFKDNLTRIWGYATAWVTTIWGAIWAYWGLLSDTDKASMVGGFVAVNKVPFILFAGSIISYVIAKGVPQPAQTAKVQAVKDASKMDAMRAQGLVVAESQKPMPVNVMTDHGALDTLPKIK